MLSITRKISNFNHSDGNDIKYIVIHDTGNTTDTAEANANYFGGGDRQASAHYFVDNDSIVQVVEDSNAAWHCGDGHDQYGIGNHNSIGIEMCRVNSTVTPTTEANTIELVKYLMNKYGVSINNVVRHYDASRKNCPSSFAANNWARWTAFKAKLVSVPSTPSSSGELFRVQTGAFSVKANADALLAKVKAAGFDTYMIQADGLYKVQVGAFSVKANADAMMAKLKAKGFDVFITTKSGSAASSSAPRTIQVGSRVKVKSGARSYNGGGVASFIYNSVYSVDELKGDRAVLDSNGICTPFKIGDLILQ
jgi:N-acetylmuramoyl-L-alanine amidase CwlA